MKYLAFFYFCKRKKIWVSFLPLRDYLEIQKESKWRGINNKYLPYQALVTRNLIHFQQHMHLILSLHLHIWFNFYFYVMFVCPVYSKVIHLTICVSGTSRVCTAYLCIPHFHRSSIYVEIKQSHFMYLG